MRAPFGFPFHRLIAYAAISVLFTWMVINNSFQHGRLLIPLTYDDIAYINSGAKLLLLFKQKGLSGLFYGMTHRVIHAPFSTALAFISLGLFGLKDWAPYAGNAVLVFAVLLFCDWLLQNFPKWIGLLTILFLLTQQTTYMAVHEFHSGFPAAFFTSVGALYLLLSEQPVSKRTAVWSGLLFAAAVLWKPTITPLIGLVALMSWGGIALFTQKKNRRALREKFWFSVAVGTAVCLPYAIFNGRHIVHYVYVDQIGAVSDVSRYKGSFLESITYYLWGNGGRHQLGRQAYALFFEILFCVALCFGFRKQFSKRAKMQLLTLGALLLVNYLVPTLDHLKETFLGLGLQTLMILSIPVVVRILYTEGGKFRQWAKALCVVSTVVSLVYFSLPKHMWGVEGFAGPIGPYDPRVEIEWRTLDEVYEAVEHVYHSRKDESHTLHVLVATVGTASVGRLEWMRMQKQENIRFCPPLYFPTAEELARYAKNFPLIIIAGGNTRFSAVKYRENFKIAAEMLRKIQADPGFTQLMQTTYGGENAHHLFASSKAGEINECLPVGVAP